MPDDIFKMSELDKKGDLVPPYNGDIVLGGPRVDFKVKEFDTLIMRLGYRMTWEQSMFCSCYEPSSGQPQYGCPVCHGKGYIYFDSKITRGVINSVSGEKHQEHLGLNDLGSALLTTLSTDNVGYRDRFTFSDFRTKFSQTLIKGTKDRLRYPADQVISMRCIVNSQGIILNKDVDFTIEPLGWDVVWLNTSIPDGTQYSILFTTPPVYVVIGIEHELRGTYVAKDGRGMERFVTLPKRFRIKREDFIESNYFGG